MASTALDQRTDAEIIAELKTFNAVTTAERNVWAYWDKGLDACPAWNQRNIISWVRRLGPSWTVRVLDLVDGSPSHVSRYLESSFFPKAFLDRSMDGPHVGPHTSDLIRLPLLYVYGGVWIDVGMLLFRSLDSLCWDRLESPDDPYEFAAFKVAMGPDIAMLFNGFLAARRGCRCIKYWHDIFLAVWTDRQNCSDMHSHPLLWHLPRYEPPSVAGKRPAFMYDQFADYLAQVFCLERLRHLTDPSVGWDGPEYFAHKVLLFDCVSEVYWAQRITDWNGRKQFDLLCARREGVSPEDPTYKEADAFVQAILDTSSTMKISHGLVTAGREYLAELWDKPENADADCQPGTFAAHLRWASEHHEQQSLLAMHTMPVIDVALLEGEIVGAVGKELGKEDAPSAP